MKAGKFRIALMFGVVLVLGASALRAAEQVGGPAPGGSPGPEAMAGAPTAATAKVEPAPAPVAAVVDAAPGRPIEVKCTIPPIEVRVTTPPAVSAEGAPRARKATRGSSATFDWPKIGHDLLLTVIFSLVGLVVALFGYFVYQWIVPFDLRKELEIDQNTSLGIVCGAIILGLCIIVAAAISSPG
jgi:putative membrane protein